jgi:hypothetical protein
MPDGFTCQPQDDNAAELIDENLTCARRLEDP